MLKIQAGIFVFFYFSISSTLTIKWGSTKVMEILAKEFTEHKTFKELLQPILVPRMVDTDSHRNVREHLINTLKSLNWHVEVDEFQDETPYGTKTFRNIIATYDPSKPQRLVLSAHYDSKNLTDGRKYFVAATDSAVPCAILLDMAKQLDCLLTKEKSNRKTDVTPQIVFFDGEEAYNHWTETDSLYGARHLADKWQKTTDRNLQTKNNLQTIKLLVLLDLIGSADVAFRNFFPDTSKEFENLVKLEKVLNEKDFLNKEGVKKRSPLFVTDNRFSYFGGGIEDDHIPFLRKGVKILHLISSPFPRVWHTMGDDETAIDYDVTDNFNRIFRTFVANYLRLDATDSNCRRKKK
ncbi:glutaminyl-peptide cyclotransferase-like [Mytilus galloprovincialis]|uniref:glutaminyl-peptide cyclotransferase-like n=1 Tax=Mytilus galloprovincialis TaxID=29158 RepID=UPI003F7C6971